MIITKDTRIIDALQAGPDITQVFLRFGMGCVNCMGMSMETIENGAKMHHVSLETLLKELNKAIDESLQDK